MGNQADKTSLEAQYREKFEGLKSDLDRRLQSFIAESIMKNSFESPELKAQVEVYRPVVESMVRVLKESGILNAGKNEVAELPNEVVGIITEQTEVINNQSQKIKELKMRVKLHEMISNHLAGLNKDIIREAITKFQGESEMPDEELVKQLTQFVNTRKPSQKKIQFESIDSDIDEVDAILEGTTSNKGEFRPKKKISIPGLKKRIVNEASEVVLPDDNQELGPADEFMRDFGHL
ncbi:MAG: hypothetical protein WC358_05255 [Ignavibacteria bacterium]|jgi:hypothetical protein